MPQTRPTGPPFTKPDSKELGRRLAHVSMEHGMAIYFATDSQEDKTVSDKDKIDRDPKLL
jgi:hypothetical protein